MSPAELISMIFNLLYLMILIRILLGWLPLAGIHIDPYHPVVRVLHQVTDPILEPFRRLIPPVGGIDFSPIVAIFVLGLISDLLRGLLGG